jgi:uncharacterized membrane protein
MPRRTRGRQLAKGLGWLSIGLGVAELLAPGTVAHSIGLRDDRRTRRAVMAMGLRELAVGVGLLAARRRAPWLWARVGGDVLDMALLRSTRRGRIDDAVRVGTAMTAIASVTALDVFAAGRMSRAERMHGVGIERRTTTAVVTVNRPREQVYAFFHDFANLPSFMKHVESVEVIDQRRSHWKVRGPGGIGFEWDAEMFEDRPNELIAWRSMPGADVQNDGRVRFVRAPGGRGTEVHAEIHYHPPAGRFGVAVAKLFGSAPGQQAKDDLRRFKQVLETGEVVHSDSSLHRFKHPATPPTERFLERHPPKTQASSQAEEAAQ